VNAEASRSAVYTALGPGDYRFVVEASAGGGQWSPRSAAVSFSIAPRFDQTPGFYILVGGVGALVAFGGYRLRVASLKAAQRQLALLVEERTRGLQQEKERAEEARHDAERQRRIAQEADALKTDILGIAAHDIKNPLQTILGLSELLAGRDDAAVAEIGRTMHRSSRRILGLIDDLLATAALEGRVELSLQRVDLARLAGRVVDDHRERAEAKRQRLELSVKPGCDALVDEDRALDVMSNLVGNAVKYCPRGARIRVELRADDGRVVFAVQDDGPGFSEDDRQRMFRRFERLSARPTGGESSTGLGLYIVKRLVELHGGHVDASSAGVGKGARFVVELPRSGPPAPR
jgi:signal transduction histidine kinase